jgi:glutamate racemase
MPTVGVFDSGVGGLNVLRAIRRELPQAGFVYVADQAHIPYGSRLPSEVLGYADGITRFLIAQGAEVVVVACNTASAAALEELRHRYPGIRFVGMEPAVKPAAQRSRRRAVGVLATPGTLRSDRFASVVARFALDVEVHEEACPGLVQRIEAGEIDGPELEAMLRGFVAPLLARGIDALVLGCTHYPFVLLALERICGPGVEIVDPSPAVARQVARVVADARSRSGEPERVLHVTTGAPQAFRAVLARLGCEPGEVRGAAWTADGLRPQTE